MAQNIDCRVLENISQSPGGAVIDGDLVVTGDLEVVGNTKVNTLVCQADPSSTGIIMSDNRININVSGLGLNDDAMRIFQSVQVDGRAYLNYISGLIVINGTALVPSWQALTLSIALDPQPSGTQSPRTALDPFNHVLLDGAFSPTNDPGKTVTTPLFTLPVGYRPVSNIAMNITNVQSNGDIGTPGEIFIIAATGIVLFGADQSNGGLCSLSGLRFPLN